jgi:CBS-domain-containing membrane protein
MAWIKKNGLGILLCLAIAVPSWLLGKQFPVIGGAVIAILAGMVVTLFLKNKEKVDSGIRFVSKKVLQWAVILLGFGLNLNVVLQTGKTVPAHYPLHHYHLAGDCMGAAQGAAHPRQDLHAGGRGLLYLRRLRHCGHRAGD